MAEEENKPKRYRRTNVDIQADIIKAAESLIKKKGFASMLVTELIKKARVEPLVFYNRYDNLTKVSHPLKHCLFSFPFACRPPYSLTFNT